MRFLALILIVSALPTFAQFAERGQLVISEIMPDPAPAISLPNAEFIEVRNTSNYAFNLNGWKLSDGTGTATIGSNYILQPDSMVILCSNSNVGAFSIYGKAIGVSGFPSLDNEGETLVLMSPQNKIIHAVAYTAGWYKNEIKKEGGWSLEMIDIHKSCIGEENWKASLDTKGGTPGTTNSVNGTTGDDQPPKLLRTFSKDSLSIIAVFDETLDSLSAAQSVHYDLSGNDIVRATPLPPLFNTVLLVLSKPLQSQVVNKLSVNAITDCMGNSMAKQQVKTGLFSPPNETAIVINEVLFNPRSNAYDYVEIYNNGNKIIDASQLMIANRNTSGVLSSMKKLCSAAFAIYPGEYLCITEDIYSLAREYHVKDMSAIMTISSMPSFADDEGNVVFTNIAGDIVDEFSYSDDMHFSLLQNKEGIALERIDPALITQDANNWHSAATTSGYGTPGYKNSQNKQAEFNGSITLTNKIISPDNDGLEDFATIEYKMPSAGYVANVVIYDTGGRIIRRLAPGNLLGTEGRWTWEGLDENKLPLQAGIYIIHCEIFNRSGNVERFKHSIVLARKKY